MEMKQCSAYGNMNQLHELPPIPKNVDCSADYELVDEDDSVYEKIPGES